MNFLKNYKSLLKKKAIEDTEAFIANKHKERKSYLKKNKKKLKREKRAFGKSSKVAALKEEDIVYIGDGYSHQLNDKEYDVARLKTQDLPVLESAKDVS